MIQELEEKKLNNHYEERAAEKGDRVFCFIGDRVFISERDKPDVPRAERFGEENLQYLFSIGEDRYFLYPAEPLQSKEQETQDVMEKLKTEGVPVRSLRYTEDRQFVFALYTAYHLYQWYRDNQYCGRCGRKLRHSHRERMMHCECCGNPVYPKIAPAVIVAVKNEDRILLTTYRGRAYKRYALIAGFTEIGETAEETVAREVMEETGIRVKNIRYYKSQPWGTDSNLLLGYVCDLDGEEKITIDPEELATAEWVRREEMDTEDDGLSLTGEMMRKFKENKL